MAFPLAPVFSKKQPLQLNGGENFSGSDSLDLLETRSSSKQISFGIFRSCDKFVDDAVVAGHPVQRESQLPEVLKHALEFSFRNHPKTVASHRINTLKHWLNRAKALSGDEAELHWSLPDSLKDILAPKRLLLWKEMLIHYGYPDVEVFDEVTAGIKLSGVTPYVASFESKFKPALVTEAELASAARSARIGLLASIRS